MTNRNVRPRPPVPVVTRDELQVWGRKINSSRVLKSRSSNRHRKHLKPLNLLRSPLQKPVSRGCGQAVDETPKTLTARC
ncbi:hypothetical protein quinque_000137 [Culex quinquefasciatus]